MRVENSEPAVRVLPDERGLEARTSRRRQRSGGWIALLISAALAISVFALSPPVEAPVDDDELLTASLSGELDLTRADPVETWTRGRIDGAPIILDVTEVDGSIVALGGEGGRAAAWITSGGDNWEPISLESTNSVRSVVSHAVVWDGNTYAFGRQGSEPAMWRAESPESWIQEATIPPFHSAFLIDVIPGTDALLATIGRPDGLIAFYHSDDAYTWVRREGLGLDEAERARALAAHGGWFYAAGSDCREGTCRPVVHRSTDGDVWEPVPLPVPESGRFTDIAASDLGIVVAGVAQEGNVSSPLLLRSTDGIDWERVDGVHALFDAPETVVEVVNTDAAAGSATVRIDGQTYELAAGASVRGEAVLFEVAAVGNGRVVLDFPDMTRTLQIGDSLTTRGGVALQRVVAQGDRLVVAGAYLTEGDIPLATAAGVWSSTDGGEEWIKSTWNASSFGSTVIPFTPSARILLMRDARGEVNTWVSEWAVAG